MGHPAPSAAFLMDWRTTKQMFKVIINSVLLAAIVSLPALIRGQNSVALGTSKRISGCALLAHPGRYNGELVQVTGTLTVGFERSDITFSCSGRLGISFSLYDPDLKKYGFLTEPESKKMFDAALGGAYPGEIINDRKSKSVRGTVVGLFRCHYDFPTCGGISRYGDSSIVVKSVALESVRSPQQ
jgi:hypothetical protein